MSHFISRNEPLYEQWTATLLTVNKKIIKFWKVDIAKQDEIIADNIEILRNGTVILSNPKEGLFIKTKDGILKVLEIQGENAKRMSIGDFLRGNRIEEFEVFE